MKKTLALAGLMLALAAGSARAQVLIDLKRGGGVRAKTTDDYAAQRQTLPVTGTGQAEWADCVRRALSALTVDSLDEARTLFEQALGLHPGAEANYIVHENLGRIAMARGRYKEADEHLTQSLKTAPDYRPARLARAAARLEAGRPREALEDIEALERTPLDSAERRQALTVRFGTHMQQRLYTQARLDAGHLLALDASDPNAGLMLILACEADGRTTEALERANIFVGRHPELADGLVLRARLLQAAGQPEAALDDIERAIGLTPAEASLHTSRAELLLDLDRKAAARAALDEAVRLGIPRAHLNTLYRRARH